MFLLILREREERREIEKEKDPIDCLLHAPYWIEHETWVYARNLGICPDQKSNKGRCTSTTNGAIPATAQSLGF